MTGPMTPAPFRDLPFLPRDVALTARADGSLLLASRIPIAAGEPHLPGLLRRHGQTQPDATWLVQRRGADRAWQRLTYGAASAQVDAVTQALLDLQRPGRCVAVLSGNGLEHGVLQLAAQQARMPHVPITPAYALLTQDLTKLQALVDRLQPAVVFVQDGAPFDRALRGLQLPDDACWLVAERPPSDGALQRPLHAWADWVATHAMPAVDASVAAITPDTVAKYLFTSGSTGLPKAVTITQRMLTTSVAMHRQLVADPPGTPPTLLLDWMPWSHVASGNIMFGMVLAEGGEHWIDDGKPVPGLFAQTLHNLRDVSPTAYGSVPLGYTMLAEALEADPALAEAFFRRLTRMTHAGARMPDSVFDRMQALSVRATGHRLPFTSAFGSTETAAAVTATHWCAESAGLIGLPHPGVTLKLLPVGDPGDGRFEVRVKSPVVTPGYLKQPDATAAAFDDEGFFCMGDALQFVDPRRPEEGLAFSGRVTEEFKLQSGVFVRTGALRVDCIEAAQGLLTDVVVAGADQAFVALLAWPNLAACRLRAGTPDATVDDLVHAPWLREALRAALARHNAGAGGGSRRVHRLLLLAAPPDMGAGEITDKGYVNQRLVLQRRADQVARLFAEPPDADVITIE
jgi:feruloyl-CoA synthase